MHTSWSRFYIVNSQASASNYQLSNMKRPARDSNRRPQGLEASTLTATPLSPLSLVEIKNKLFYMCTGWRYTYGDYLSKDIALKRNVMKIITSSSI